MIKDKIVSQLRVKKRSNGTTLATLNIKLSNILRPLALYKRHLKQSDFASRF